MERCACIHFFVFFGASLGVNYVCVQQAQAAEYALRNNFAAEPTIICISSLHSVREDLRRRVHRALLVAEYYGRNTRHRQKQQNALDGLAVFQSDGVAESAMTLQSS